MDKPEEITSDSNEPEEIPRLVPSTIKHKPAALSSSHGFPSFENPNESGTQISYRPSIRSSQSNLLSSQLSRLPYVLEKEREKEPQLSERPLIKRTQSRKSQNANVSRMSKKLIISPSPRTTSTENIGSIIKAHENRNRKVFPLRKSKRRSKIFSTKPTIEVFSNVRGATVEESDEEFEEREK